MWFYLIWDCRVIEKKLRQERKGKNRQKEPSVGLELLHDLNCGRLRGSCVRVVIVSLYVKDQVLEQAVKSGIADFVPKPIRDLKECKRPSFKSGFRRSARPIDALVRVQIAPVAMGRRTTTTPIGRPVVACLPKGNREYER